jgi:hypothetical protein
MAIDIWSIRPILARVRDLGNIGSDARNPFAVKEKTRYNSGMKRTLTLAAMALALASFRLAAQQSGGTATIVFADGTNLTVVRGPREIPLKEPVGEILAPGDYLQTGKRTSVEIVTLPRKSVLRVAENTTFRYLGSGEDGVWGVELLYGRIRARAEGPGTYEVRANSANASAVGGDFGMDIVVTRGQAGMQGRSEVYCFEGSVTVKPGKTMEASGAVPVVLSPGKAAESYAEGGRLIVSQTAIAPEKKSFWFEHDFRSEYAGLIVLPEEFPSVMGKNDASAVAAPAQAPAPIVAAAPVYKAAVVPVAEKPVSSEGSFDLVDITPSAAAVPSAQPSAAKVETSKQETVQAPASAAVPAPPPPEPPATVPAPPPPAPPVAQSAASTETKSAEPFAATAAPSPAPAAPSIDWEKYRLQVVGKNILIGVGSLIVAGGLGLEAWAVSRFTDDPADPNANDLIAAGISTSVVGAVIGVIGLMANPRAPSR